MTQTLSAPRATFPGTAAFEPVLRDLALTCLDVGARGGITSDLTILAPWVNAIGFEPDQTECDRLNEAARRGGHGWRSLRYIPTALGRDGESRQLHLYSKRGCSSLYEANTALARSFARQDYFHLDGTIPVETMALDVAATTYGFEEAAYLKIDIQGGELEVLQTGPRLLTDSMLAIRTEVELLPVYLNQPLFSELEQYLRQFDFVPIRFMELQHWRLGTRAKHPELAQGPIPYSRGQMVHGDVLFMRGYLTPDACAPVEPTTLIRLALLALAHEAVDYAALLLHQPHVAEHLQTRYGLTPGEVSRAITTISFRLAREYRQRVWLDRFKQAKRSVQQILNRA